ncbi:MAG: hypothetical protein RBR69_00360 [Candidatus Cloacimonadaceae bacterium]|nr:hypothetical protein [Candidatus Cloacimonadota bacterium]MDY0126574.1 hypothetical protein [Candidatus Cloacimonadaceae bacterium]MCB5255722.1 hypothetical protein [Candidatus Cloacimonadota bacterium]MCK9178839.1 hypothetical protein [Candidatus Cloacimonadota bacterium]MCK9242919.1 hypothetical protein [Candidatus Cloacimonadota bacterium]
MNKLYFFLLIALCLIAICCCDYVPPETEGRLVRIDEDGIYHLVQQPAEFDTLKAMKALPDGNLLLLSDQFYLYHTATNTVSKINTSDSRIQEGGSKFCLSPEGDAIFYCTPDKIWRKDLLSLAEECLVDSAGATYYSPFLSKDARYLAFLRRTGSNYAKWEGYPLYLDLQTNEVVSLATGDEILDNSVTDCWIDHFHSKYMFSTELGYSDYFLNSMDMDGNNRAVTTEIIRKGALTADGRYLLPRPDAQGSSTGAFYFRNNLSMLWTNMDRVNSFNISRAKSLIYYYKHEEKKLFKYNLATKEKQVLFNKSSVQNRKIQSVTHISPRWDDDGLFAMLNLIVPTQKDREE